MGARWEVQDSLQLGLQGIGRVMVRLAAGSVRATTEPGDARCEVTKLNGDPVDVCVEGGTLRVSHPAPTWDGAARTEGDEAADIVLTVPPGCELDVQTQTASVSLDGFTVPPRVQTRSGRVALDGATWRDGLKAS